MPGDLSTLACGLRDLSAKAGLPIPLGHAQQLVAAALGYASLAAYQSAIKDGHEPLHVAGAKHLLLHTDLIGERTASLGHQADAVTMLLVHVFKERLPGVAVHESFSSLEDTLIGYVDAVALREASGPMAETNGGGIDEIYLPFDFDMDELVCNQPCEVEIDGHISLEVDLDRPYCGHKIDIRGTLTLTRYGRSVLAAPECDIVASIRPWGDDEGDRDAEEGPPLVSLAEALADELKLTVEEADTLTDVDAFPEESNDDFLYGYVYDFTDAASPQIRKKLMAQHGSLQFHVPPWFFERVHTPFQK